LINSLFSSTINISDGLFSCSDPLINVFLHCNKGEDIGTGGFWLCLLVLCMKLQFAECFCGGLDFCQIFGTQIRERGRERERERERLPYMQISVTPLLNC